MEDFALDLQHRFEHVPPYSLMEGVERKVYHFAIGATNEEAPINRVGTFASFLSCCTDGGWCGNRSLELEAQGSDHLCKIFRMRLGLLTPDVRGTLLRLAPPDATVLYRSTAREMRAT